MVVLVRAQAGASRDGIRGQQDGALKVSVTQVAEKGKANRALRRVLARQHGLRKSQLQIIAGQTASQKRFLVREISIGELAIRVRQALSAAAAEK